MTKRHSKKRELIRGVLESSHAALSASEIHAQLREVDLVTIYRNLELFVGEGTVKKLHLGGTEALYEFERHPHHHAVCTDCSKIIHFTAPDSKIKELLGLTDFNVEELELTVRGTCKHLK